MLRLKASNTPKFRMHRALLQSAEMQYDHIKHQVLCMFDTAEIFKADLGAERRA